MSTNSHAIAEKEPRHATPAQQRQWYAEPALWVAFVVLIGLFVALDRPLAVGDGLAYLIWLDSIALDGDLDLSNQAEKFAAVNTYHIYHNPHTGRWASAFPLGIAILLTPFYWLGALLDKLPAFRVNDAHFLGIQGVPYAYTLCAMLGVNLYALLTAALGYRLARRFLGPWAAAAAVLATFVGTPLLFYSTVDPINSHIAGAFAATLVLSLWLPARKRAGAASWRDALPWLWVGLTVGLTALGRWQIALIALPIGIELLIRRQLRKAVLLVAGFCLLVWVIPYSWWQMYGKLALIPATEGDTSAVLIGPVNTLKVLFSPIAGLFPWSPLAALALVGLWPLAKKDWPLAASLLAMVVLQALVNGMVRNWWAGIGFGMRRMAELYPVYLVCLAALVRGVASSPWLRGELGWGRVLVGAVWAATAALALYGLALVFARMSFTWTNPWGLARDTPLKELRYAFAPDKRYLLWPVIKDHVGIWAWKKPGP
jgi:hypothetical protein